MTNEKSERTTIFGEVVEDLQKMKISLNIKKPSEFFWVRKIRDVDIRECCAKCFIGQSESLMYHATANKQTPRTIEVEVAPSKIYKAYYLCGLAKNFYYPNNTHVAFVYEPGGMLYAETSQIELSISNARRIDFEAMDYKPNPEGYFTNHQRTCRNWIFANFLKDGMLEQNLPEHKTAVQIYQEEFLKAEPQYEQLALG